MPKLTRYLCIAFVITALAIPAAWLAVQRTDAFSVASSHIKNSIDVRSRLGEIQDIDLSSSVTTCMLSAPAVKLASTLKSRALSLPALLSSNSLGKALGAQ